MPPRTSDSVLPRHQQDERYNPSWGPREGGTRSGGASFTGSGSASGSGGKSSKSRKRGRTGFHVHRSKKTGKRQLRPETEKALSIKNHTVAFIAEFIGTTSFLFFAFGGTNVANGGAEASNTDSQAGGVGSTTAQSNSPKLQYIALSFGFSLMINVWIFFRVSGGLFNPAVSLALCLTKAITPFRCVILTVSQLLGGMSAAALIYVLTPGTLNIATSLAEGVSIPQGLFMEMFLTALLVLTILLLAVEKHRSTYLAPIGIGLALFVAELTGVPLTGGSLNPCRSFGPEVVGRKFSKYHWIYWVGPYLGSIIAVGLYKFFHYMDYETVNPDQDAVHSGQAPIQIVINEEANAEIDPDTAVHFAEKGKNTIRSPSNESVVMVENSSRPSPAQVGSPTSPVIATQF